MQLCINYVYGIVINLARDNLCIMFSCYWFSVFKYVSAKYRAMFDSSIVVECGPMCHRHRMTQGKALLWKIHHN